MTFEQFQATRREEADLGAFLKDDGFVPGARGLIYCGALYVEDTTALAAGWYGADKGRWYTLIGRNEYQSDDLETVERVLYGFALAEGYTIPADPDGQS
jgi:hypothetical protein